MLTPKPQESLAFYSDVLGLETSAREGASTYLRGWGERDHHSLVLTESEQAGMEHRVADAQPAAPRGGRSRLQRAGVEGEWIENSVGHGPAFSYRGPGGHRHELLWETEPYVAPPELRSPYPNRPQAFRPRGIGARSSTT